jgi:hypothetical protein
MSGVVNFLVNAISGETIAYGDTVQFYTAHQRNICADPSGLITADRTNAGLWESFTVLGGAYGTNLRYGDQVCFVSAHGYFLCAEQNGALVCNREAPQQWETFTLVDPKRTGGEVRGIVALLSYHSRYVCVEPNHQVIANRTEAGEWETLRISRSSELPTRPVSIVKSLQPNGLYFNDLIKLKHMQTGRVLCSRNANYVGGTKQQVIYASGSRDDQEFFEVVPNDAVSGPVIFGSTIRLKHCKTGRYLHSHTHDTSPVTKQQEVTCYWLRDQNDYWVIISPYGQQGIVTGDSAVHLVHSSTGRKLHSHNHSYKNGFLSSSEQEVTCYGGNDNNDDWRLMEIRGRFLRD